LGIVEALYGVASFRSHVSQPCGRLDACRQSGDPEAVTQDRIGTDDCGLHYRHAVAHLLVVMDVLGPETSVTLYRTYRRIRWITPVIRRLERKRTRPGRIPGLESPSCTVCPNCAHGMRLCLLWLVRLFAESITYMFSMGPRSSNPSPSVIPSLEAKPGETRVAHDDTNATLFVSHSCALLILRIC
jgi:hypothetical protein